MDSVWSKSVLPIYSSSFNSIEWIPSRGIRRRVFHAPSFNSIEWILRAPSAPGILYELPFQFHWMDSRAGHSICDGIIYVAFNSIEWIPQILLCITGLLLPFNSIEWIRTSSNCWGVSSDGQDFQFHWMDSVNILLHRLYILVSLLFQFHWMDSQTAVIYVPSGWWVRLSIPLNGFWIPGTAVTLRAPGL